MYIFRASRCCSAGVSVALAEFGAEVATSLIAAAIAAARIATAAAAIRSCNCNSCVGRPVYEVGVTVQTMVAVWRFKVVAMIVVVLPAATAPLSGLLTWRRR